MSTEAMEGAEAHLSIGEVLDELQREFPDVTISKIRFLESQGLIDPERTPSGYRRFYPPDLERLRWILVQQRDHFLPLRVIKERLDAYGPTGAPRIGSSNGGGSGGDKPAPRPAPEPQKPSATAPASPGAPTSTPVTPRPTASPAASGPPPASAPSTPSPTSSPPKPAPAPSTAPRPAGPPAAAGPSQPQRPSAPPPRPTPAIGARPAAPTPKPAPKPQPKPFAELGDEANVEDDEERFGPVRPAREKPASTDLTRAELIEATGLTDSQLDALESFGIVIPHVHEDGKPRYDDESLSLAELAAGCYRRGIEARHLKMYWHFAEREAALFAQVLLPYVKQRNPQSKAKLQGELEELTRLGRRLRTAMLRRALRTELTG